MRQRRNQELTDLREMVDALEAELGLEPLPAAPPKRRVAGGATGRLRRGGKSGVTPPPGPLPAGGEGEVGLREGLDRPGRGDGKGGEGAVQSGEGFYPVPESMRGARRYRPRTGRELVPVAAKNVSARRWRWGEAARRAARREMADGEKGVRSLRAVREAFPMSQQELADRAGLARSTISELEAGRRRAYPSTRRVIARALKVEAGEIRW